MGGLGENQLAAPPFLTGCVANGCARVVSPWIAVAAPPLVGFGYHAWRHVRAARMRAAHAHACDLDDDARARRPLVHDAVDLVRETLAILRLGLSALRPPPRAWRSLDAPRGGTPIVVLFPARGLPAASLRRLGRRLADDLGVTLHVEPRAHPWVGVPARVERMGDRVAALRATAPRRPLVLLGHGDGGRVACAVAARVAAPVHAVALATEQAPAAIAPVDTTCVYSTRDAIVVPPERAYLSGAFNVALDDVGHFAIVLDRRPYDLVREAIAAIAPPAAAAAGRP